MATRHPIAKQTPPARPDLSAILHQFDQGLAVVETACTAIISSETLTAETQTLQVGIRMLLDAYAALDVHDSALRK